MVTGIIGIAVVGYIGFIFLIIGLGLIADMITGNWELFRQDFGYFVYLNGGLGIGLGIGMFTFVNLLNWMTQGYFAINMFDPNKWGFIFLTIGIIFYFAGKAMMKEQEIEKKQETHKYVTLKSGKRVQID
jgi:hypothetical protein